ncbi:endonuclease [Mangrovimonas sp. DI 80]|uniref:endonuclease n=1 Tax=Mangrovimonas sp. DI 80 TaxID=1779330 RepID=UPI0009783FCE|nr:endonuclease [Mangrovimonas sp. DI 80]OMP31235.1 hypothetical protein BKM32_09265 [Mangrovimonas sp. DI 80]
MKHNYLLLLFFMTFRLFAQIPEGYYDAAEGLDGYTLKTALKTIIDDIDDSSGQAFHDTSVTYSQLWTLYQTSDVRTDGKVWDVYSDCDFEFGIDQDNGTGGTVECDKYNREHTFPRSWFGNNQNHPIFADAFHILPTDKKVNAERGNLAFGEVSSASYTSLNGSQRGSTDLSGPVGEVFEPVDDYKGDIARGLFYIAVRYQEDVASWETNDTNGNSMLDGTSNKVFEQWALDLLYSWHINDPVSTKEIDRNNAIFEHQDNRNPFIDHPEYVSAIWQEELSVNEYQTNVEPSFYPNPVNGNTLYIDTSFDLEIQIYSVLGKLTLEKQVSNTENKIDISKLNSGIYLVKLQYQNQSVTKKLIKQ